MCCTYMGAATNGMLVALALATDHWNIFLVALFSLCRVMSSRKVVAAVGFVIRGQLGTFGKFPQNQLLESFKV